MLDWIVCLLLVGLYLKDMDGKWYSGKQDWHNRRQQKTDEVRTGRVPGIFISLIYFCNKTESDFEDLRMSVMIMSLHLPQFIWDKIQCHWFGFLWRLIVLCMILWYLVLCFMFHWWILQSEFAVDFWKVKTTSWKSSSCFGKIGGIVGLCICCVFGYKYANYNRLSWYLNVMSFQNIMMCTYV